MEKVPAGMIMYRENVEINLSPKIGKFIPNDLIVEILSWLPVKSLVKFKCVCKSWKIIIQDQSLIQKHMVRSKAYYNLYVEKSEPNGNNEIFQLKDYSNGLVLEESEKTGQYRIRNPATKQVLEVLDDPEERRRYRRMLINLDLSTNNCKLICIHSKKGTTVLGFKILTIGTDHAWRPLDISLPYDVNERLLYWAASKEVKYVVSFCEAQVEKTEIIRFDLEAESFMKIKIPPGFQSCGDEFQAFSWDEKLSLGFIIDQEFHMWGLENFEKQTWSKKIIIPLDFMKKYPSMSKNLRLSGASKGRLLLIATRDRNRFEYDFDSKILYPVKVAPGKKIICSMVPCLVSLKGMHTEDINPLQEMHSEAAIKPNLLVQCIKKIRGLRVSRHKYFSCFKPFKKP